MYVMVITQQIQKLIMIRNLIVVGEVSTHKGEEADTALLEYLDEIIEELLDKNNSANAAITHSLN